MKNAAGDRHREIELVRFFEEICAVLTPLFELTNNAGLDEFQQACENIQKQMGYNTANKMVCMSDFSLTYNVFSLIRPLTPHFFSIYDPL